MNDPRVELAIRFLNDANQLQMDGELEGALDLYKKSIALHPTAEAYTYLGWTYRFLGRLDEAILECKHAIELDPSYGSPYNDIGAYLLEKGNTDDAIPWLEKATQSERFDSYHFPWYNLGRAYTDKGMYRRAQDCFQQAIDIEPEYLLARQALDKVKRMMN
ncbi:MAG: tetratricopeptide repeat protein [Bryobacter sp.]|nr:tetratricopeptide repeat protein [Bryobacter sp.]